MSKKLIDKAQEQKHELVKEYIKAPQEQKTGLFQKIVKLCQSIFEYKQVFKQ